MQVDTRERGFSYAYDAPLDMRMDPDDELDRRRRRQHVGGARLATLLRDYGEERYARPDRPRDRPRARPRAAARRPTSWSRSSTDAMPVPARFAAGHPAKRVFQAIRIAVNDELGQLDAALPAALGAAARTWPFCRDFLPFAGRPPREALPGRQGAGMHLPAGAARCAAAVAIPEAELLTRRAMAPTPGEVAANPRARSARMRAARKLEETHA